MEPPVLDGVRNLPGPRKPRCGGRRLRTPLDPLWELRRENTALRELCHALVCILDRHRTILAVIGRGPQGAQTDLANAELRDELPALVQAWLAP